MSGIHFYSNIELSQWAKIFLVLHLFKTFSLITIDLSTIPPIQNFQNKIQLEPKSKQLLLIQLISFSQKQVSKMNTPPPSSRDYILSPNNIPVCECIIV